MVSTSCVRRCRRRSCNMLRPRVKVPSISLNFVYGFHTRKMWRCTNSKNKYNRQYDCVCVCVLQLCARENVLTTHKNTQSTLLVITWANESSRVDSSLGLHIAHLFAWLIDWLTDWLIDWLTRLTLDKCLHTNLVT